MKILFIDDDRDSVEAAIDELAEGKHECQVVAFEDHEHSIATWEPDIVVLDWVNGSPEDGDSDAGARVEDYVWKTRFCPVIIYSAFADRVSSDRIAHPFVVEVNKGANSDTVIRNHVEAFTQHIEVINSTKRSVDTMLRNTLRDTASYIFDLPESERVDAAWRISRRRIAALMDGIPGPGDLSPWEQYIYPAVTPHLNLGDILQTNKGDAVTPDSFRVILTPSCDLANNPPKVDNVLVACCEKPTRSNVADKAISTDTSKTKEDAARDTLKAVLNRGFADSRIPLPELRMVIPHTVVNLRKLEMIALIDIQIADNTTEKAFKRVASIDSPFREMISWAYLQTAGRTGLPNRNLTNWIDELLTLLRLGDQTNAGI